MQGCLGVQMGAEGCRQVYRFTGGAGGFMGAGRGAGGMEGYRESYWRCEGAERVSTHAHALEPALERMGS